MRFVIVGLGSMGKRRIRCLRSLGVEPSAIHGYDIRSERRQEAMNLYGVSTSDTFSGLMDGGGGDRALIISTPPNQHAEYMVFAATNGIPFFVEASVLGDGIEETIRLCAQNKVIGIPSATLLFHPGLEIVQRIYKSGALGRISNINMEFGQYLPDWHPYEPLSNFYASIPEVGGGRESVPFEFSFLAHLFGFPRRVCGFFRKTVDLPGAEKIDDTYQCLFDYGSFLASLNIDVVARTYSSSLVINGDKGQVRWDEKAGEVRFFRGDTNELEITPYDYESPNARYDNTAAMYINETQAFITMLEGGATYPNTFEMDLKVLKVLYAVERSDRESRIVELGF